MCGRFAQYTPASEVARHFEVDPQNVLLLDWQPRYNLAPSEQAMVVRQVDNGTRLLQAMRWGLMPHWAKPGDDMPHPINARAETVDSKPFFRSAFGSHRCLIPCDGFYEWKAVSGGKQPYFIRLKDEAPFALAGLWDHWEGEGDETDTFTILVTEANKLLHPVHDRMPVILPRSQWGAWLSPATPKNEVKTLLQPYPSTSMTMHEVSRRVNRAGQEGPDLIAPAKAHR